MEVKVTGIEELKGWLDRLPERVFEQTKDALRDAVLAADTKVKDNLNSVLHVRTGALRRSVGTEVSGSSVETLKASIYSKQGGATGEEVVYARIQEMGGRVVAKRAYSKVPGGPYLNIPTDANKTPAGVTRKTARQIFTEGGYIAQSRAGRWGVFLGGKMMFVLKKEVTILARMGMRDAAEEQIPTLLTRLQEINLE